MRGGMLHMSRGARARPPEGRVHPPRERQRPRADQPSHTATVLCSMAGPHWGLVQGAQVLYPEAACSPSLTEMLPRQCAGCTAIRYITVMTALLCLAVMQPAGKRRKPLSIKPAG